MGGAVLYNFSIPIQLKTWVDCIAQYHFKPQSPAEPGFVVYRWSIGQRRNIGIFEITTR